jgi:hypothetical protein
MDMNEESQANKRRRRGLYYLLVPALSAYGEETESEMLRDAGE